MVVLGLMALMMGLVVPSMYGAWHRAKERANLRKLMTTMRSARSLAASRHRRVRVFLNLESGRYRLEGTSNTGQLSRSFRLHDAHLVWQDRGARQGSVRSLRLTPSASQRQLKEGGL